MEMLQDMETFLDIEISCMYKLNTIHYIVQSSAQANIYDVKYIIYILTHIINTV